MKILINKQTLKNRLLDNRKQHEQDFLKMVARYKDCLWDWHGNVTRAVNAFQVNLDAKSVDLYPKLQFPRHYLAEYDRVLEMLEVGMGGGNTALEESVELDEGDFDKYWNNRFSFQQSFSATKSAYGLE